MDPAETSKGKRLFINMTASTVSFAVSAGISFFLTPFIVEKLGREAYGFVGLANNFISYAEVLVTALNSLSARFISTSIHRRQYETARQYFSSLLFSNIILAVALSFMAALVVIFMDRLLNVPAGILPDVRLLWSLLFLQSLIGVVMSVFGSATYVRNRLDMSSKVSIVAELSRAAMLILAFTLLPAHVYYLGVTALVCLLYRTAANIRYTRMLLPEVKVSRKYFRWARIKELLSAGVWSSVTSVGNILSNSLDLLVTNLLVGASAMGVVSLAKNLPAMILSMFGMLSNTFTPSLNISYAKNDVEDMQRQLIFAMKLLGMIACVPIACVLAFGDVFFSLWVPGEDAHLLQWLSMMIMIGYPVSLALEPFWNLFWVANKLKQSSIFLVVTSFISVGVMFGLLHLVHTDTAKMFVVVGASAVNNLFRSLTFLPIFGARCVGMKPGIFYKAIVKNVLAALLVSALAWLLRQGMPAESWLWLVVMCAATGAAALLVNFFVLLQKQERAMLMDKLLRRTH